MPSHARQPIRDLSDTNSKNYAGDGNGYEKYTADALDRTREVRANFWIWIQHITIVN